MNWFHPRSGSVDTAKVGRGRPAAGVLTISGLSLAAALTACGGGDGDVDIAAVATYADGSDQVSPAGTGDGEGTGDQAGDVVVTYSEWDAESRTVVAGGYVPGIIEDGGVCTLTLTATRSGEVVTGEEGAVADATTTSCGTVRAALPDGEPEEWSAELAYRSPSTRSSSEPFTVTGR